MREADGRAEAGTQARRPGLGTRHRDEPGMGRATGNSPWLLSVGLNPCGSGRAREEEQKSDLRAEIPNPSSPVSWDHGSQNGPGSSSEGHVPPKGAARAGCAVGPGGRRRRVSGERRNLVQGTKSKSLLEKSPQGRRQAQRLDPAGDGKPPTASTALREENGSVLPQKIKHRPSLSSSNSTSPQRTESRDPDPCTPTFVSTASLTGAQGWKQAKRPLWMKGSTKLGT